MSRRGLALLAALVIAVTPTSVPAGAMFIPPISLRVAQADCVIVGTVTAIEAKPVLVPVSPGSTDKIPYQIAVVKIEHAYLGARGLTTLRVGMFPQNRIGRGPVPVQLSKGQEVCLFLHAHPEETFYTTNGFFDVIDKKSLTFARDSADPRHYAQMLSEPRKALQAKSAEDRYLAAALLVLRYNTLRPGQMHTKKVPIDATESKLIMAALAEGNWKKNFGADPMLSPQYLFSLLDNKKGWTAPADAAQFPAKAQQWVKDNATTYRIERFPAEGKTK